NAEQAAKDLDALMFAAERLRLNGFHAHLAQLAGTSGPLAIDRFVAVVADARRFGRLIDQDGGADAALAAAAAPLHRARSEIAGALSEAMAVGATAARTAAESLVRMAAAGIADGGIAVLVLQALGDAAAVEPALAALGMLAADMHGEGADGTDLLSM